MDKRKSMLIIPILMFIGFSSNINAKSELKKQQDGVTVTSDNGLLKIKVCEDNLIQVKYTTLPKFVDKTSLVVNNKFEKPTAFKLTETGQEAVITTSKLSVYINKKSLVLTYKDLKGNVILSEDNKRVKDTTVADIKTYLCETVFNSPIDEALYGLGCHPEDTLSINYKGRKQDLAIRYMTGAIPVLLSTKGYGLLWDNYSASVFDGTLAKNKKYKYVSESGNDVNYYFFFGPNFDEIISAYRVATGVAPIFPKWAYGLFQSQDRYKSEIEVLSVKDSYRMNNIPVDCIVQDWFYWEPNVIGSHVMWPERYPNPKYMVNELHKANIHGMISIWPVFSKGTPTFAQMEKAGAMTDMRWMNVMTNILDYYYDAHSESARNLYWRQACDSLVGRYNWDAWWVDQCEPDNGNIGEKNYMDLRKKSKFAIGQGIDYFNSYSLAHTEGLYNNWRKDLKEKRVFLLSRQAFAGQQRNAATLWSSDITCTWKAFKSQVPQGINACVSGIPYWTSDIGGYHLGWQAPDWSTKNNRELFTRWFQFGTFSPIFRIHGKGERAIFSKNWDEKTRNILLTYDNLRYRLIPYIYSLGWKVYSENYTIMRSLAFDFREDKNIVNIPDQYMFGNQFLVNPITDSSTYKRNVYLPQNTTWYDFWTGKSLTGGQTIAAECPIETLPLYVKAGSIIPMGQFIQYATESKAENIEIRIYTGADGKFTIYEDENETYNYEKGAFSTIDLKWDDKAKTITIEDRKGSFNGMVENRKFNIVIVTPQNGIGVELSSKYDLTIDYSGKKISKKL